MGAHVNKYAHLASQARASRVCEAKKAFETEEAALKTGNAAYKCHACGKWHTTTRMKKLVKFVNGFARYHNKVNEQKKAAKKKRKLRNVQVQQLELELRSRGCRPEWVEPKQG